MAIKVKLGATENAQQEKPFPKLMKGEDGSIIEVLSTPNKGGFANVIVRYSGNKISHCDFRENFNVLNTSADGVKYTDYNEPITIQNA